MKRRYRVLFAVLLAATAYLARPRHAGETDVPAPEGAE